MYVCDGCLFHLSTLQEVCVWHVQFLGFETPSASWVQATWGRWWRRAATDCQVRQRTPKNNQHQFTWLGSFEIKTSEKLIIHHNISHLYRCCRRASMDLPLTVRFKHLKATSKETVGVYRSDQFPKSFLKVILVTFFSVSNTVSLHTEWAKITFLNFPLKHCSCGWSCQP